MGMGRCGHLGVCEGPTAFKIADKSSSNPGALRNPGNSRAQIHMATWVRRERVGNGGNCCAKASSGGKSGRCRHAESWSVVGGRRAGEATGLALKQFLSLSCQAQAGSLFKRLLAVSCPETPELKACVPAGRDDWHHHRLELRPGLEGAALQARLRIPRALHREEPVSRLQLQVPARPTGHLPSSVPRALRVSKLVSPGGEPGARVAPVVLGLTTQGASKAQDLGGLSPCPALGPLEAPQARIGWGNC